MSSTKEKPTRWKGGISLDRTTYQRDRDQRLRKSVIEALGGKCVTCEFSDPRALQIDHINGGGQRERKKLGYGRNKLYQIVLASFLAKENKYQLLCANCNWIKRYVNNEIPNKYTN